MAKTESTFKNMVLTLTLIAFVAATCLGFVYELTKKPIEMSALKKKLDAIKLVVPEFTNNPDEEVFRVATGEGDSLDVYPAKKDGVLTGYAVNTYTKSGFSGDIRIMAGFKPDGTINYITVLEHKETPGLGTKMDEPAFKNQFIGKNPSDFVLRVNKDGGPVDAITAATISSRAFCDAVQRAYNSLFASGEWDGNSGSTESTDPSDESEKEKNKE
ncbi:MAG: RnfABCDGE type electron transport complex subunit G [Bacteroidales bacterium]